MAKKLLASLLAIAMAFSIAACSSSSTDDSGTDTGDSGDAGSGYLLTTFRVGVKEDVPGFSKLDTATGQYVGMEADLARLLAKELTGDEANITYTPVTAASRGPALDNGELDAVIATFTITDERKLSWNFSTPYYQDAVGLLVKKDSGYTGLKDLDGKIIGVATSSTSQKAIEDAAALIPVTPTFQTYDTYPDIKSALDSGRVDAFSVDRSILRGYLDDTTVLLDDKYSPQDYGIATKLDNTELTNKIEELITQWLSDGTIQNLIDQHNI